VNKVSAIQTVREPGGVDVAEVVHVWVVHHESPQHKVLPKGFIKSTHTHYLVCHKIDRTLGHPRAVHRDVCLDYRSQPVSIPGGRLGAKLQKHNLVPIDVSLDAKSDETVVKVRLALTEWHLPPKRVLARELAKRDLGSGSRRTRERDGQL
jgi:hypothetical protein